MRDVRLLRLVPRPPQELTLEDVEASVKFLKEKGLSESQVPKARRRLIAQRIHGAAVRPRSWLD